jgi:hypothetical protein
MEVAQTAADGAADTVFEVNPPRAFADAPTANFTLGWIDFYR